MTTTDTLSRRFSRTVIGAVVALLLVACSGSERVVREPEEEWLFPISHILIRPEGRTKAEAYVVAKQIRDSLRKGQSFAELAEAHSEAPESRVNGGFEGFMNPHHETRFSGAVQTLEVGRVAGPVETQIGWHILLRHSFEEGRRLEAKYYIPVYGFFISSREAPEGADRSLEEARALAEEAWQKVHDQEMNLEEAAAEYGDGGAPRPNAFLGMANRSPEDAAIYAIVKDTRPGGLAPLAEADGAFAILARGEHFRSIVRHILIHHVGVQEREMSLTRTPEEAVELALQIRDELAEDGSNWTEMVARFSDDVGTVPLNGAIGAYTNGELPPELEAAIRATEPGAIHEAVIPSEQGVHILWRVN
ncbi:MAG: peptidylprolyl isomerase [Planctomycetota bacterium]